MSDQAPPGLDQPAPGHPAPGRPTQGRHPQDPAGPDGPYSPPPRTSHRARHIVLGVLGVLVIAIVIVVVTSRGGGPATPGATNGTPQVLGSPPPRPASPTRGIGASFAARDAGGRAYRVRLDLIVDPAQPTAHSAAAQHGTRFVAAVFTVRAVSGRMQGENAWRDARAVGSDGQSYRPVGASVAGYAGFRGGHVSVTRGASATGAVTFQLPDQVTVSTVTWSAARSSTLTWPVR